MRRILGYDHGRPIWSENEPHGFARRQGYGGQALGSVIAPTMVAPKPRVRVPHAPLAVSRNRAMCSVTMRTSRQPCARTPGHGGCHRSAYDMDHAALIRRAVL